MTRLDQRLSAQRQTRIKRSVIVVTGLLFFALVTAASYFLFSSGLDKNKNKRTGNFISAQDKVNILVMGVDERSDDVGRSDTMFVITVDTKTKSVALLSIPRDTRLKIPGHGWDKINHAYAEGGVNLSKQAVENLLGIPMDYTVTISFSGFVKMIDALGGVTIDVDKRMYYSDPYDDDGGLLIDLRPGLQRLNGQSAVQYVRYRDEEGDIGRVARQQKFLKAVLQEAGKAQTVAKLPELIKQFAGAVRTDMPVGEMLKLIPIVRDAAQQGLSTDSVDGTPVYIQDVSYWLPNIVDLRQKVANSQGVVIDERYMEISRRLAQEYEKSLPREIRVANQTTTAKEAAKPDTKADNGKINVEIFNASGHSDAGEKMSAFLLGRGFAVADVINTSTIRKNTVIVLHPGSNPAITSAVVDKLNKMPFTYSLQISSDDAKDAQVTVVIGQDYINP